MTTSHSPCSTGHVLREHPLDYTTFIWPVINRTLAAEHSPLQLDLHPSSFSLVRAVTCTVDGRLTRASCMTGKLDCPCHSLWHQHTPRSLAHGQGGIASGCRDALCLLDCHLKFSSHGSWHGSWRPNVIMLKSFGSPDRTICHMI